MNPLCSEEKNPRTNAICPALPVKRHCELLRLLRIRDQMTIREVASQFKVSVDTARRDLDFLASQGLLARTYGGAVAIEKPKPQRGKPLQQMTSRLFDEKRLARLLDRVIKDGETLLLNGGSTTKCCAEELGSKLHGDTPRFLVRQILDRKHFRLCLKSLPRRVEPRF
jgi:DeoR/GlpR family transcriptional regulator of sugar metabolism